MSKLDEIMERKAEEAFRRKFRGIRGALDSKEKDELQEFLKRLTIHGMTFTRILYHLSEMELTEIPKEVWDNSNLKIVVGEYLAKYEEVLARRLASHAEKDLGTVEEEFSKAIGNARSEVTDSLRDEFYGKLLELDEGITEVEFEDEKQTNEEFKTNDPK